MSGSLFNPNQYQDQSRLDWDFEPLIAALVEAEGKLEQRLEFSELSGSPLPNSQSPGSQLPNSQSPNSPTLKAQLNTAQLHRELATFLSTYSGYQGRRSKAALLLLGVWGVTLALHYVAWGIWVGVVFAVILAIHGLRLILAGTIEPPNLPAAPVKLRPMDEGAVEGANQLPNNSPNNLSGKLPTVALLVAAKDEESVIGATIERLCQLDYPADCYEVWAINDNSSDRTGAVLEHLTAHFSNLHVIHRGGEATGGKSGALNRALEQIDCDIVAVFDADAIVKPDFLQRVLPQFENPRVGAVQVRKVIANADDNFWTQGQASEMILDAYLQGQRYALHGIGELRGNGQVVRREALDRCGNFNEVTITDDLDLTLRLHLDGWDIRCSFETCVYEEGVTSLDALWHQRSRWAEGGYQRYVDYWRLLNSGRLSLRKRLDLVIFIVAQYLLPTAAIPDAIGSLLFRHLPVWSPLTATSIVLSFVWMLVGLRRIVAIESQTRQTHPSTSPSILTPPTLPTSWLASLGVALRGTLYMVHWIVVIAATTARMSIRPKRLKWVKTVHRG